MARIVTGLTAGAESVSVTARKIRDTSRDRSSPMALGRGVGHRIVAQLIATAKELELARIFVLTFETRFFGKHGFVEIDGTPVSPEVYEEIMRSADEGVAEFLDLSYVKPNTLGNSRMLLHL